MEFKEFTNPESRDYDITSSLKESEEEATIKRDNYSEQIINLIGIIEDIDYISDEDFIKEYGILKYEYLNPTADTVRKAQAKINATKEQNKAK